VNQQREQIEAAGSLDRTDFYRLFFMGVNLGVSSIANRRLRVFESGCWGAYLDLRGMKRQVAGEKSATNFKDNILQWF
jgi:hypothetical protein